MKHSDLWIGVCLCALFASTALAQVPVKSVDKAGNVTYADKPAEDAVSTTVVPIDPGPDPSRVEAAQEEVEHIRKQADSAEQERKAEAAKRQAAREAATAKKASQPEVIIIKEDHGGYPVYNNPPLIRPPVRPKPPGSGTDHPAYRPPGNRPPTILPVPRSR